jgi:uracil-DNA glycosylase
MGHRKKTMQVHSLFLLLQEEMGRERIQYLKGNAAEKKKKKKKKKKGSSAKARNGSLGFWVVVVVHLRSLLQTWQKPQPTMLDL